MLTGRRTDGIERQLPARFINSYRHGIAQIETSYSRADDRNNQNMLLGKLCQKVLPQPLRFASKNQGVFRLELSFVVLCTAMSGEEPDSGRLRLEQIVFPGFVLMKIDMRPVIKTGPAHRFFCNLETKFTNQVQRT